MNQPRFPKVADLAMQYLCVPATSVPAERVFSTALIVVNRLRARMSAEHVDMIIFLRKNYHDHDSYTENGDSQETTVSA